MAMLYTSIENKKIKDLKKLQTKKYREKTGLFLVEGRHLVLEAYRAGRLEELILEQDELFPLDVKTLYVTNNILSYLSEMESVPTIMGVCQKQPTEEVIGDHLLLLDGIQDPGNLGTIIRSAVAFHVDTVVLGENTVDLYNSKTVRSSQGMLFHTNVIRRSLLELIPYLKDQDYHVYGTRVTHGMNLKDMKKQDRFAVVMGNEGNGMSEEVAEFCDDFIYINMNPECESLNVGVATSIILYELDK